MVIVRSSDGVDFEFDCNPKPKPPPKALTSKILAMVSDYCNKHSSDEVSEAEEFSEADLDTQIDRLLGDYGSAESRARFSEYLKKYDEAGKARSSTTTGVEDEVKAWDAEFVNVDQETLFDLIVAADYLNIQSLGTLTTDVVAEKIKGKTPQEIQDFFNMNNDFTRRSTSPG